MRRQGVAQLLGLGVDDRQLLEPLGGGDAVAVAGPVEVAVVEIGQRRPRGRGRDGAGDPLTDPVGVDPVAAALGGQGEPRAAELPLVDRRDLDAGGRRAAGTRWGAAATARGRRPCPRTARSAGGRSPGTREVKPTTPWAPGVSPVPSEVRLVAVVDGTPAVPVEPGASSEARYGAACAVSREQVGPQPVDQEHDVRRRRRERQRRPLGPRRDVRPERSPDRGQDVGQRALVVRRLEEVLHVDAPAAQACVRAESDSAKASSDGTASGPSAAAETRIEKSSAASVPV